MKRLIELNKEWIDKSNELFADFLKRSGDAYLKDVSFLNMKRDVYFALSGLMFHLTNGKGPLNFASKSSDTVKVEKEWFEDFNQEIRNTFAKFEEGRTYTNSGFIESTVDLVGRRMHAWTYDTLASSEVAEVQKKAEQFWKDFFHLKNTGDAKADQKKLDELLDDFEKEVTGLIAA